MKFLAVFALAVACVSADVSHIVAKSADANAEVVRSESEVNPEGFKYIYETNNGIQAEAQGVLKNVNAENPAQVVTGRFSYPGPDGVQYTVTYVADENGYQPQGAHLPVAPEIPKEIQRSLDFIAAHPQAEAKNEYVQRAVISPVQPAYKPVAAAAKPFAYNKRF